MIKEELIDQVKEFLQRNDETQKYHPYDVELAIEKALSQLAYSTYAQKISNYDILTKEFPSEAVLTDATTLKKYVLLPAKMMQIPGSMTALRGVYTEQSEDIEFFPMTISDAKYHSFLEVSKVYSGVSYVLRNDRIDFYDLPDEIVTVRLYIIIPFSEYLDTDNINIPNGQEQSLYSAVLELLANKPPIDLKNDNA